MAARVLAPSTASSFPGDDAEIRRLVGVLTERLVDPWAIEAAILSWIHRNIAYRLDRSEDQEAGAVLRRRTAYCTGAARLAVAMLRAAGLEAREVAGFAFGSPGSATPGYHRWIEVRRPGGQWAFSDPMAFQGFVPATYVPLAEETIPADSEEDWELLETEGELVPVTADPRHAAGFSSRLRGPDPGSARLRVETASAPGGTPGWLLVLRGSWVQEREVVGGVAHFVDLEPGRYRLEARRPGAGEAEAVVEVELAAGTNLKLLLEAPGGRACTGCYDPGDVRFRELPE